MADLNTKQKILNTALRLFNEYGLVNVRLQRIANETGISVGNLAYHFRHKEALIAAVQEHLHEEIAEILAAYRIFPNLMDFDNQLSKYFAFFQKYPFFFLDLLEMERTYPNLPSNRLHYEAKNVSQIRKRLDFNQQRGVIVAEPRPGLYDSLAQTTWLLIAFQMPQQFRREAATPAKSEQFKRLIWNQFFPYFSPKGQAEFEQLIVPLLYPSHL